MSIPQSTVTLDLGDGAASVEATGWSITRELSGNLPGQVRSGSGIAASSGTVTFRVPDGRTPWKGGAFTPGGLCSIDAAEDVGLPLVPAARMVIRGLSSAGAMTPERSADIEDVGITKRIQLQTVIGVQANPGLDAAWVIDQSARAMGYHQTPEPVPSAVVACSALGAMVPEVGTMDLAPGAGSVWATSKDGRCYLSVTGQFPRFIPTTDPGLDFYVAVTVPSTQTKVSVMMTAGGTVGLTIGETSTTVSHNSGTVATSAAYVLGSDRRLEFRLTIGSTSTAMYVKTAFGGSFASAVTATGTAFSALGVGYILASNFLGLQVATADDGLLWGTPTASINPSGSILQAILPGDATTAWGLIQDAAQSTLGAAWIEGDGTLVYRNKEAMRGAGPVVGTVDALTSIVDIASSISMDDQADRVEIDYSPPVISTGNQTVTVWSAENALYVSAHGSASQIVTLDGSTGQPAPFFLFGDSTGGSDSVNSRLSGNTKSDGTGTVFTIGQITARASLITPTTVKLTYQNLTANGAYLVDTSGNPAVTLRSSVYAAAPDQTSSVASGISESKALNPLTVDCGQWVQDSDTASELQDWLAGMVAQPLPTVSQVQVVPNSAVKMGDVWRVIDPVYTGLSAKCLVTAVDLAATPGGLTQTLNLVILGVSLSDIDGEIAGLSGVTTIADLDTAIASALGASPTIDQVQAWLEQGVS